MNSGDFGWALAELREGEKVCRTGWNGKNMYIFLQPGYPEGVPINQNTAKATGIPAGTEGYFRPYLMMYTAQGDFVPWVASQTDILADDWEVTV